MQIDEKYVCGNIRQVYLCAVNFDFLLIACACSFIVKDPGCQMISGSFRPINVGDWSGQAYEQARSGGMIMNWVRAVRNFLSDGVW